MSSIRSYTEAVKLIESHQEAGRRVYLVSRPPGDRDAARPTPRRRCCDRKPGQDRRRGSIHGRVEFYSAGEHKVAAIVEEAERYDLDLDGSLPSPTRSPTSRCSRRSATRRREPRPGPSQGGHQRVGRFGCSNVRNPVEGRGSTSKPMTFGALGTATLAGGLLWWAPASRQGDADEGRNTHAWARMTGGWNAGSPSRPFAVLGAVTFAAVAAVVSVSSLWPTGEAGMRRSERRRPRPRHRAGGCHRRGADRWPVQLLLSREPAGVSQITAISPAARGGLLIALPEIIPSSRAASRPQSRRHDHSRVRANQRLLLCRP